MVTTSGTYNFFPSNGEIVQQAFDRIQVRAPGLRAEHMRNGFRELNLAMVRFSNQQPNLWAVALNTATLTQGIATLTIATSVVMIVDAYRSLNYGSSNQTDIYMTPISRTEYASYAAKATQGPPIVYWFDRTIPSQTVTFYPVPDGNGPYTFSYYTATQQQDAGLSGGQQPAVPYRFLDALTSELAYRLGRIYPPPPPNSVGDLKMQAKEDWQIAAAQDTENVPLVLAPGISAYYRR